jgi:hypothetical protein
VLFLQLLSHSCYEKGDVFFPRCLTSFVPGSAGYRIGDLAGSAIGLAGNRITAGRTRCGIGLKPGVGGAPQRRNPCAELFRGLLSNYLQAQARINRGGLAPTGNPHPSPSKVVLPSTRFESNRVKSSPFYGLPHGPPASSRNSATTRTSVVL